MLRLSKNTLRSLLLTLASALPRQSAMDPKRTVITRRKKRPRQIVIATALRTSLSEQPIGACLAVLHGTSLWHAIAHLEKTVSVTSRHAGKNEITKTKSKASTVPTRKPNFLMMGTVDKINE